MTTQVPITKHPNHRAGSPLLPLSPFRTSLPCPFQVSGWLEPPSCLGPVHGFCSFHSDRFFRRTMGLQTSQQTAPSSIASGTIYIKKAVQGDLLSAEPSAKRVGQKLRRENLHPRLAILTLDPFCEQTEKIKAYHCKETSEICGNATWDPYSPNHPNLCPCRYDGRGPSFACMTCMTIPV